MPVHGSCVAIDGRGILLRGPSGSGKSDLALRLIEGGARLVADDQVELTARDGGLFATAPAVLCGRLEIRGIGVVDIPALAEAPVVLIVDLVDPQAVERLPAPDYETVEGITLPRRAFSALEASAPAKVRFALRLLDAGQSPRDSDRRP